MSLIHFAFHGDAERGEIILASPPLTHRKPNEEDYLLTMGEISKVQLRAKLVVLSCCHSAQGEISSEGVVGIALSLFRIRCTVSVGGIVGHTRRSNKAVHELFLQAPCSRGKCQ